MDNGCSFGWEIDIVTKDIVDEKAYYISCNNMPDALHIIQLCCYKYKVEEIHIEDIGFSKRLYDAIIEMELPDVDIVPMKYIKMKI